jgi:predicted glutamine amidotransferase
MCAIGGILKLDKRKTFDLETQLDAVALLTNMEKRGTHSWGVYIEKRTNNLHLNCGDSDNTLNGELFKIPGAVSDFFNKSKGRVYLDDVHTMLMHTRQATHGSSDINKNNHPFTTKNFILSHNGIIQNANHLKKKYNLTYDIECDSYIIVALIQHKYDESGNVQQAIIDALSEIEGGFACWLYHKDKKDIYVFRNSSNPFEYFIDKDRGIFIFASEDDYIVDAYNNGLKTTDVSTLSVDTVYKLQSSELVEVGRFTKSTTTTPTWGGYIPESGYCNGYNTYTDVEEFDSAMGYFYKFLSTYDTGIFQHMLFTIRNTGYLFSRDDSLTTFLDDNGFKIYKKDEYKGEWTRYSMAKDILLELAKEIIDNLQEEKKKNNNGKPSKSTEVIIEDMKDLATECHLDFTYNQGLYTIIKHTDTPKELIAIFKKYGYTFKRRNNKLDLRDCDYHNRNLISIVEDYLFGDKE